MVQEPMCGEKHTIDPIGQGAKIAAKIVAWESMDQPGPWKDI